MMNTDFIMKMLMGFGNNINEKDFKKETTKKFMKIIIELAYAFRDEGDYSKYIYTIGKIIGQKIENDDEFEKKVIDFMDNIKKIL